MGMNEELIEEYIESFESLSADDYFDEMKPRIEQGAGVPMFLLAIKYVIEGRFADAEEFYSRSDITFDEANEIEDFITETLTEEIDYQHVIPKLFNSLLVEPNEVEMLWKFELPDTPQPGERISVWERWGDDSAWYDWIYKWYYPMARQQGMSQITWDSLISYSLSDHDTNYLGELKEREAFLRKSILNADETENMIDDHLTKLFIEKGGPDYCRIFQGDYINLMTANSN